MKSVGIVAVDVVRESRNISLHPCIGHIARSDGHLCDSTVSCWLAFDVSAESTRQVSSEHHHSVLHMHSDTPPTFSSWRLNSFANCHARICAPCREVFKSFFCGYAT